MGILCQGAGEKRRGIVARLTMTSEFNAFLVLQVLDVLLIERLAKSIAVRRLSPLCMRICVAGATTLGRHEHFTRNKGSRSRGRIARRKRIGPKLEIVSF